MNRRVWLASVIALAGCTRKPEGPPEFPKYAGDWTLTSGPNATEAIAGANGAWTGDYSGNPPMRLTICEMQSQTSAFDAVQRWRAEAGKLAFYKGPYFAVIEAKGADHPTLNRFAAAIRSGLPER
jgi:hypothetical protein